MQLINLESQRLYYRELQLSDDEAMFALDSVAELDAHLYDLAVTDIQQSRDVITYVRSQYAQQGVGRMATFLKETGEFIGWTGLKLESNLNGSEKFYDIGYHLMPQFWGKGYATEATEFFLDYAFNVLNANEVNAYAPANNMASIRVLEKCGFQAAESFMCDGEETVWFGITNNVFSEY